MPAIACVPSASVRLAVLARCAGTSLSTRQLTATATSTPVLPDLLLHAFLRPAGAQLVQWFLGGTASGQMQPSNSLQASGAATSVQQTLYVRPDCLVVGCPFLSVMTSICCKAPWFGPQNALQLAPPPSEPRTPAPQVSNITAALPDGGMAASFILQLPEGQDTADTDWILAAGAVYANGAMR